MKSLRFNWINGTISLFLLGAYFVVIALSSSGTAAHAAATTTTLTVNIAQPVTSVQIVSVEGGYAPICLTLPRGKTHVTASVGSNLPYNVFTFKKGNCQGNYYNLAYTETGAPGTSLTINVP